MTLQSIKEVGSPPEPQTATVAERLLAVLRRHGIEDLFLNAGTDFAPLIEAYAARGAVDDSFPRPVLVAHENAAAAMAHGAYLATGRPQAVMVHVGVGTANLVCAVANAAREQVPLVVLAGRTPVLEAGAVGARDTTIQWAQEMYDQAGMLREFVKWDYGLHDARHLDEVLSRAFSVASAPPQGPVYLTLPREVLAEPCITGAEPVGPVAAPTEPEPDRDAVGRLADRVAAARSPLIVVSAAGADQRVPRGLGDLCARFAIGVAEFEPGYANVTVETPYHVGYRPGRLLPDADVCCFLECPVPWVAADRGPGPDAFVAQCGVDPLAVRYPVRSHRSDLTITSSAVALVRALGEELEARRHRIDPGRIEGLRRWHEAEVAWVSDLRDREANLSGPITKTFMAMVMNEVLSPEAVVFNEYWLNRSMLGDKPAGSYFYLPRAGGLGWALPAALGTKRAQRDRTVVAAVGDGSYLFANPAACHHAAAKHALPVLTVVANNEAWAAVDQATWAVYPHGEARQIGEDRLSGLGPVPAFERYAESSGGYGERVEHRDDLRPALIRGLQAVEAEGRQALLNVMCR